MGATKDMDLQQYMLRFDGHYTIHLRKARYCLSWSHGYVSSHDCSDIGLAAHSNLTHYFRQKRLDLGNQSIACSSGGFNLLLLLKLCQSM